MKKIYLISIVCFSVFSCNTKTAENPKDVFAANIDTTVNPADDFFLYADGKWIKNNPIPAEESSWGIGNVVDTLNQGRLREISEAAAKEGGPEGSATQMIGDFWTAAMDSDRIEKQGTEYLKPYFKEINAITNIPSFINTVSDLNKIRVNALFSSLVDLDDKNSEEMSFKLNQGGLGLPERDYYFNKDSSTTNIRKAYSAHVASIETFLGRDSLAAAESAVHILTLETSLAKVSRSLADLRDPYSNYHKIAITDLGKISSTIDWRSLLKNMGVTKVDSVIVGQPEFFKSLDNILKSTPIPIWKDYLTYRLVNFFSGALPEKYGIESFQFNQFFSGAKERRPRWKRAMAAEETAMGELLGQLYVKRYFNETAKQRYETMTEAIRSAYKDRIQKLRWMSDSTKQKAILKLEAIKKKIGYPDIWKNFSGMQIGKESYVQNMINVNSWWHRYDMNKLGKPVDRNEWSMYPQTYNAYYDPDRNEMVFPAAAFIVPGFEDKDLDDATMYGYVGASTIGHEITHGFDDQGRLYDAKGNLHNWWTKNDSSEFVKRAAVIINQFDGYEPFPGVHVNGKASQGENIADLGGLELGIEAFKKTDAYKKNELIGGLTPMQRFFLGYALSWLYETRPERMKYQLMVDVHSPEKYRVIGPLSNIEEFYSTFNIKAGDKMYRADSVRVHIW